MTAPERSLDYRRACWDRIWSEWLLVETPDEQSDEAASEVDEDQAAA